MNKMLKAIDSLVGELIAAVVIFGAIGWAVFMAGCLLYLATREVFEATF